MPLAPSAPAPLRTPVSPPSFTSYHLNRPTLPKSVRDRFLPVKHRKTLVHQFIFIFLYYPWAAVNPDQRGNILSGKMNPSVLRDVVHTALPFHRLPVRPWRRSFRDNAVPPQFLWAPLDRCGFSLPFIVVVNDQAVRQQDAALSPCIRSSLRPSRAEVGSRFRPARAHWRRTWCIANET